MAKILKYIVIVCLVFSIGFVGFKYFNRNRELDNSYSEIDTAKKVFEDPEMIVYQNKGKEKFKLTQEDKEYKEILDRLNSSLVEGYTSKEVAFRDMGYGVPLDIVDIQKEIYLKNSVLRLFYSDTYEIDIIFEKNSVLDIIYIENGKTECFYGFEDSVQEEIREFIDNI